MSVSFKTCGKGSDVVDKHHRIALEHVTGCSNKFKIKNNKICVSDEIIDQYYTIHINVVAKARCPVDEVRVCLANLNNDQILGQVTVSDPCTNTISVRQTIPKGSKLVLVIKADSGICYVKAEGQILAQDIATDQLAKDQ